MHPVSFNVRLEEDPFKAEEIELLRKMCSEFAGSGTYLENLFTPQFCDWAEQQIKNDFTVNVYDYYVQTAESLNQFQAQTNKNLIDVARKIDGLSHNLEIASNLIESNETRIKSKNERIEQLNETAEKLSDKIAELTSENERLNDELLRLKAKLYDINELEAENAAQR